MNESSTATRQTAWLRGLGGALILLGLAVAAGWLLHIIELTRIVAPLRSMVLNTALSFVILGGCLIGLSGKAVNRFIPLAAAIVLSLGSLNLLQHIFGVSLGLDLPEFHAWADDGNPHPGRMSLPTSLCFVFGSLSVLLACTASAKTPRRAFLGRGASNLVLALGSLSLLGYVLDLESVFGIQLLAGMALHTVLGMLVLAAGLSLAWELKNPRSLLVMSASQLLRYATWAPALIALIAGTTGIMIFKKSADEALLDGLKATQAARISEIDTILSLRGTRAGILATRPALKGDIDKLRAELEGFVPFGFSHIDLRKDDGSTLFTIGDSTPTQLEMPLHFDEVQGQASLVWTGEHLLLRLRSWIRDDQGAMRQLLSEQPLPAIDRLLHHSTLGRLESHLQLCSANARQITCLSSDRLQPEKLPRQSSRTTPDPIRMALDERHGVHTFRGEDGQLYNTAYGAIGRSGLISTFRVDADTMNRPIRKQLILGLLLILIVTAAGTTLLRRRIGRQTAELLRVREHHGLVVDSLQEGLILQNAQGTIITSNPAALRILGLTRDGISGRTSLDPRWRAIHEDGSDWPGADHPAMRTLRSGEPENNVVMGLRREEGETIWISVSTAPAGNEGVVTTFSDITEKRAAELRERELQGRFRLLVDGVRDYAICMLDVSGRVSAWNSGAERLSGYSSSDIIGRHFSAFCPQEDIDQGKPEKELLIAEASGRYTEEGWRVRKNGSRFWAQVVINSIRDEDGRLLGYAKISRDLSERRQAENALAESSALRQAIVDSAPFSIIATDAEGTIRSINPAARRMLWYAEDDLVGKASPALIHDPEEVRCRAMELSAELGEHIEPGFEVFVHQSRRGISEEREWTYIRKDGSRFPVNLAVTALRDIHGEISGFLGIAYDITERKRREEYTRHVADHDHLTGLPNRGLLNDRLQLAIKQAQRIQKGVAVLMLDLDHFKRVNDSLGHHIGDLLLVTVAQRVRACLREADTVARMGGDEFVIVLPEVGEAEAADVLAQHILRAVSEPVTIAGHDLQITPSIGISLYPRDGTSAGLLLRNADVAMYSAKAAGRGEVRLFSTEIERVAIAKLAMENALRRAIKRDELVLHYQPQLCVHSGRIIGVEALLRWPDGEGGMIAPEAFIPIAEECGLILTIGDWVLRTACREGLQLQKRCGYALKIAVNISPKQFQQADFVSELRQALEQSGLAPRHLELEITEHLLMSQTDEIVARLHEIRAMGVGIAIDDFGVGYSSLSYITRFPISTLKIDRCFISQIPGSTSDVAVTQTIIDLASNLHIGVVAEGVETTEQLAFLKARALNETLGNGVGPHQPQSDFLVQGFHFCAALGFEALAEKLERLQPPAQASSKRAIASAARAAAPHASC